MTTWDIEPMVFRPGQSGNPGGRREAKAITNALWLASKRVDTEGRTALNRMAEKIMAKAVEGEAWACQFVTERLEGKVAQPVSSNLQVGPSSLFLEIIKAISDGRVPEDLTIDADSPALERSRGLTSPD
jgi:hypothetical protein